MFIIIFSNFKGEDLSSSVLVELANYKVASSRLITCWCKVSRLSTIDGVL